MKVVENIILNIQTNYILHQLIPEHRIFETIINMNECDTDYEALNNSLIKILQKIQLRLYIVMLHIYQTLIY